MDMVKVDGKEVMVVEYKGKRVLTTEQVADGFECEARRISENFKRNEDRFEEGKHFVKLEGEELKQFKVSLGDTQIADNLKFAPVVYLWTKRGVARHSKMLGTDQAWDMFDCLEENYFNPKQKPMDKFAFMAESLRIMQEQEERLTKVENTLTTIKEVFKARKPEDEWREEVRTLINGIVNSMGDGNTSEKYRMVVSASYDRLSKRANINLTKRLKNAQKNYREIYNASESEAKAKVSKVQVIQKDKKIADIYLTILKEMAIQYGVVV